MLSQCAVCYLSVLYAISVCCMFLGHWDLHIPVRGMRLTFGKHQATMSIRLDGTACDGMGRGGDVTNPVRVTRITAMATRVRSYSDSKPFWPKGPSNRASMPFQYFKPSLRDQWTRFACPRVLSARSWITRMLFGSHTSCTSLPS